jgi:hypothetical protein
MPQLGLGTEIGRVSGGAYDSDALAYFSRAGIASGTQTPSSYDNAASFTSASSQFLTSTAANLQCQSQSFTVAGWFFMPSNAPAYSALITQGAHPINAGGGFTLQRFDNFNAVYLTIRNDNASTSVAVTSPVFVPSTWNFVECGWDSALNQSFISINGGTRTFSTAVAGWTFPNTTNITRLGRDPFGSFLTGNLAGWGLWKRALTASEVTALFNSGAGRTYASLDSGLRTNLVSWWALNQNSVTADSHGTNTLTNNGTVTAPNIGPIITGYSDSRRLISDFVRGIKSLGLWNSMVCWPLRASQNASTTLTARSLGGLGTFDGSLFGLATSAWGANGLAISNPSVGSNSQRIDLASGIGTGGANIYSYGAGMITSSANFNRIIQIENAAANTRNPFTSYGYLGGAQQFLQADLMSGSNTQVSALQNNATIPLNTFGSMSAGVVGNTLTAYNNTTAGPTATSPGGWSAPPGETTRSLGVSYNGTLSMVVLGRFEASASLVTSLNNLYKQTLLLGLGLP